MIEGQHSNVADGLSEHTFWRIILAVLGEPAATAIEVKRLCALKPAQGSGPDTAPSHCSTQGSRMPVEEVLEKPTGGLQPRSGVAGHPARSGSSVVGCELNQLPRGNTQGDTPAPNGTASKRSFRNLHSPCLWLLQRRRLAHCRWAGTLLSSWSCQGSCRCEEGELATTRPQLSTTLVSIFKGLCVALCTLIPVAFHCL